MVEAGSPRFQAWEDVTLADSMDSTRGTVSLRIRTSLGNGSSLQSIR